MGVLAIKRHVPITEALLRTSCPYRFLETKLVARKLGAASSACGLAEKASAAEVEG